MGFPDKLVDALVRGEGLQDTRWTKDALGSVADCSNALTLCSSVEDFEAVAGRFIDGVAILAVRLLAIKEACIERTAAHAKQMLLNLAELTSSPSVEPHRIGSIKARSDRSSRIGEGNLTLRLI